MGTALAPKKFDHGFVNRKAGIGIDDLVASFTSAMRLKNMIGLPPGTTTTSSGDTLVLRLAADFIRNCLTQFGQSRTRTVVCIAVVQGVHCRIDDVRRSIEIGLANFQVNDISALCFQGSRLYQNFKGSFRAQPRHALGQTQFSMDCFAHRSSSFQRFAARA